MNFPCHPDEFGGRALRSTVAARTAMTAQMIVRRHPPFTMSWADDADFLLVSAVLDFAVIISVAVNRPRFFDERFSTGFWSRETLGAAVALHMIFRNLPEFSVDRADDLDFSARAVPFNLGIIIPPIMLFFRARYKNLPCDFLSAAASRAFVSVKKIVRCHPEFPMRQASYTDFNGSVYEIDFRITVGFSI